MEALPRCPSSRQPQVTSSSFKPATFCQVQEQLSASWQACKGSLPPPLWFPAVSCWALASQASLWLAPACASALVAVATPQQSPPLGTYWQRSSGPHILFMLAQTLSPFGIAQQASVAIAFWKWSRQIPQIFQSWSTQYPWNNVPYILSIICFSVKAFAYLSYPKFCILHPTVSSS